MRGSKGLSAQNIEEVRVDIDLSQVVDPDESKAVVETGHTTHSSAVDGFRAGISQFVTESKDESHRLTGEELCGIATSSKGAYSCLFLFYGIPFALCAAYDESNIGTGIFGAFLAGVTYSFVKDVYQSCIGNSYTESQNNGLVNNHRALDQMTVVSESLIKEVDFVTGIIFQSMEKDSDGNIRGVEAGVVAIVKDYLYDRSFPVYDPNGAIKQEVRDAFSGCDEAADVVMSYLENAVCQSPVDSLRFMKSSSVSSILRQ